MKGADEVEGMGQPVERAESAQLSRWSGVTRVQMALMPPGDPPTMARLSSEPPNWKSGAKSLVHDILDVAIATVAAIVVVCVFVPVYLVGVLAKTVARRADPTPTA